MIEDAGEIDLPNAPATEEPEVVAQGEDMGAFVRNLAESRQGKNHYQIFDLEAGDFSAEKLKEAYFAITRKLGAEALICLGGEEAIRAEEVLSTVATAYNTLSDEVTRERYDELLRGEPAGQGQRGDDALQAQVRAEAGKVFIEKSEWDSAEKALQDACNIEPKNGDYLAHLAWPIWPGPYSAIPAMPAAKPCSAKPYRSSIAPRPWSAPPMPLPSRDG